MAEQSVYAAPNLCNVCVDENQKHELQGRLYHYYSPYPLIFESQFEILNKIDKLCNWLNYPQETEKQRSFGAAPPNKSSSAQKVERCMSKEKLTEPKGKMATFVVHVMYRQNATWQGTVTWAEKDQKASFRSALELIKLIDSAVETTLPPSTGEQTQGSAQGIETE